jgi:hypothetical protein
MVAFATRRRAVVTARVRVNCGGPHTGIIVGVLGVLSIVGVIYDVSIVGVLTDLQVGLLGFLAMSATSTVLLLAEWHLRATSYELSSFIV